MEMKEAVAKASTALESLNVMFEKSLKYYCTLKWLSLTNCLIFHLKSYLLLKEILILLSWIATKTFQTSSMVVISLLSSVTTTTPIHIKTIMALSSNLTSSNPTSSTLKTISRIMHIHWLLTTMALLLSLRSRRSRDQTSPTVPNYQTCSMIDSAESNHLTQRSEKKSSWSAPSKKSCLASCCSCSFSPSTYFSQLLLLETMIHYLQSYGSCGLSTSVCLSPWSL